MEKIKSLADQLREQMIKPWDNATIDHPKTGVDKTKTLRKKENKAIAPPILEALRDFDNSDHKTMVHYRFDKQTVDFLNQFKIATGVDATKFVIFSVKQFIEAHPELKSIIKQFIQNTYL